ESGPDRDQARGVEGIDHDRDDQPIKEQIAQAQHDQKEGRQALGHAAPLAKRRRIFPIGQISSASIATATDAATGQSWLVKNSSHSTLPIIRLSGPPRRSGMTNSPTIGMDTSSAPAATPGSDSGRVTLRKARNGLAPRSDAASSSVQSSFSRLA